MHEGRGAMKPSGQFAELIVYPSIRFDDQNPVRTSASTNFNSAQDHLMTALHLTRLPSSPWPRPVPFRSRTLSTVGSTCARAVKSRDLSIRHGEHGGCTPPPPPIRLGSDPDGTRRNRAARIRASPPISSPARSHDRRRRRRPARQRRWNQAIEGWKEDQRVARNSSCSSSSPWSTHIHPRPTIHSRKPQAPSLNLRSGWAQPLRSDTCLPACLLTFLPFLHSSIPPFLPPFLPASSRCRALHLPPHPR